MLTQGAITGDALKKTAGAIGARYTGLRDSARCHTDDIGRREGSRRAC